MKAGLVLILAGVFVAAQVLKGGALDRLLGGGFNPATLPGTPAYPNAGNQPIIDPATGKPYPAKTMPGFGSQKFNPIWIAPSGQPVYGTVGP